MAMQKITDKGVPSKPKLFPMSEMKRGEVCYCEKDRVYVLKVSRPFGENPGVILILDDNSDINTYGAEWTGQVRKLYDGESVTIKFS